MVLDKQRNNIDPILLKISQLLININPNKISWFSLVFAFLAGIFFYLSNPEDELFNYFLYFATLFIFLNGLFDAIDGKVAKISKKSSIKGDFLDHALDRYGDVIILGGLALSSWNRYPTLGILAISGMLLTSYMGTQSQAIGYKRNYSGFLGRADRLILLMFAAVIQHLLLYYGIGIIYNFYIIEWILIYFSIFGNITAIQRFYHTLMWLDKDINKK
jgi:archaetidylinositol phosphate synthase